MIWNEPENEQQVAASKDLLESPVLGPREPREAPVAAAKEPREAETPPKDEEVSADVDRLMDRITELRRLTIDTIEAVPEPIAESVAASDYSSWSGVSDFRGPHDSLAGSRRTSNHANEPAEQLSVYDILDDFLNRIATMEKKVHAWSGQLEESETRIRAEVFEQLEKTIADKIHTECQALESHARNKLASLQGAFDMQLGDVASRCACLAKTLNCSDCDVEQQAKAHVIELCIDLEKVTSYLSGALQLQLESMTEVIGVMQGKFAAITKWLSPPGPMEIPSPRWWPHRDLPWSSEPQPEACTEDVPKMSHPSSSPPEEPEEVCLGTPRSIHSEASFTSAPQHVQLAGHGEHQVSKSTHASPGPTSRVLKLPSVVKTFPAELLKMLPGRSMAPGKSPSHNKADGVGLGPNRHASPPTIARQHFRSAGHEESEVIQAMPTLSSTGRTLPAELLRMLPARPVPSGSSGSHNTAEGAHLETLSSPTPSVSSRAVQPFDVHGEYLVGQVVYQPSSAMGTPQTSAPTSPSSLQHFRPLVHGDHADGSLSKGHPLTPCFAPSLYALGPGTPGSAHRSIDGGTPRMIPRSTDQRCNFDEKLRGA